MSCQKLMVGGQPVYITWGPPTEEIKRRQDGLPRWCFRCRKVRVFNFVVTAPIEPSYYDPNCGIYCTHCGGQDTDLFPGREREWEW